MTQSSPLPHLVREGNAGTRDRQRLVADAKDRFVTSENWIVSSSRTFDVVAVGFSVLILARLVTDEPSLQNYWFRPMPYRVLPWSLTIEREFAKARSASK